MGNFKQVRNFLVRILIQKDNTDDKVLETNFIKKNQRKKIAQSARAVEYTDCTSAER